MHVRARRPLLLPLLHAYEEGLPAHVVRLVEGGAGAAGAAAASGAQAQVRWAY